MSDLHYFNPAWINPIGKTMKVDVCVYGATSAGIIAAIRAHLLGKSVALLHPGKFIGGLTTGGLGLTDYGRKHVIGGLSREFYRQVGASSITRMRSFTSSRAWPRRLHEDAARGGAGCDPVPVP